MIGNIINSLFSGKSSSNNRSEEASERALKEQDEMAARMTNLQSKSAQSKMRTDATNSIMAGFVDSASKASNAVSSSAKEIRY